MKNKLTKLGASFILIVFVLSFNTENVICMKSIFSIPIIESEVYKSELYERYKSIEINSSLDTARMVMGDAGELDGIGLFHTWKNLYGFVRVVVSNNKIIHKMISIDNFSSEITFDFRVSELSTLKTKNELFDLLGSTPEFGLSMDPNYEYLIESYIWQFEDQSRLIVKIQNDKVVDIDFID